VWHPVGPLPARVYWRRRLLVLVLLLALVGGGIWLGITLLTGRDAQPAAATEQSRTAARVPAIDRVVPSLARVSLPAPPKVARTSAAVEPAAPVGPARGGPCADDMIGLAVRAPTTVAIGSQPTFELVVSNVSAVPCVRALDKGLQEILLVDGAGKRVWGSNDCFPEISSDARTLGPGEVVAFPLVWSGLTSEPTCTGPRSTPAPGAYVLRARLGTKGSPDTPLTLG
jgi:hypothetical protein